MFLLLTSSIQKHNNNYRVSRSIAKKSPHVSHNTKSIQNSFLDWTRANSLIRKKVNSRHRKSLAQTEHSCLLISILQDLFQFGAKSPTFTKRRTRKRTCNEARCIFFLSRLYLTIYGCPICDARHTWSCQTIQNHTFSISTY